jgi:hypothetical protein
VINRKRLAAGAVEIKNAAVVVALVAALLLLLVVLVAKDKTKAVVPLVLPLK